MDKKRKVNKKIKKIILMKWIIFLRLKNKREVRKMEIKVRMKKKRIWKKVLKR
jgi:hypothetical protein